MQSFLVISKKEQTIQKYIEKLCKQYEIGKFDQKVFVPQKSIGIEDIRLLQQTLFLAPLQYTTKALIIYQAETMTLPAQNAFLKTLEEPPNNTLILLIGSTKDSFLPTFLSRTALIEDVYSPVSLDKKEYTAYQTFFASLSQSRIAQQLFFAQDVGKTKESALVWLEKALWVTRENMLQTKNPVWIFYVQRLQKTHTLLSQTNANARLAMEQLFFDIVNTS